LWFVAALIVVEAVVLFAFWIARSEPLVDSTKRELVSALARVKPALEARDLFRWTDEELELLTLRVGFDMLSVVTAEGKRVAGDAPVFPPEALTKLLATSHATWTVKAIRSADPRPDQVPWGPGQSAPVRGGPSGGAGKAGDKVILELLPAWPIVGAALPFQDLYGRPAFLVAARTAAQAVPPAVLRAVAWVGAIGLISAAVAAWAVLGRAVRPLMELAESARHLSPERRDGRLEAGGNFSEVDEARRSLNAALDRLGAGYDALDLFIGNVTHELRTPIATVLAEARLISLRAREPLEYQEFVQSTGDEMSRLGKMIQSFLTLARMDWEERREMVIPVSLFDVAVEVVQSNQASLVDPTVRIVLHLPEDGELEVDGDPELVTSMVDNLVRNGVRFSPQSGVVTLEVSRDEDRAMIRVRDQGPGIPEPLIERAFEPFVQDPAVRPIGRGSGIGLAIAQKVVELHRGRIVIGNHCDGGCEVIVSLPLRGEHDVEPPDESRDVCNGQTDSVRP